MRLHVVAFNVPYPPDYGGVIDVFYKIKALAAQGVKVQLHCFQYGRTPQAALEAWCEKVYYYPRRTGWRGLHLWLPYIVASRRNDLLIKRLSADDYPILLEGLHCCYALPRFRHRFCLVRMHNVEWAYYAHLAATERHFLKKMYFTLESRRLRRYEAVVHHAAQVLAISPHEATYFARYQRPVTWVAAFHANETVTAQTGSGDYVLFHADFSVADNAQAAAWLLTAIAPLCPDCRFVLAGLRPPLWLVERCAAAPNVALEANLSHATMQALQINAHIHFLWSFQSAGMKLKLLNALYLGRHCVANDAMIGSSGLDNCCTVVSDADSAAQAIHALMQQPFSPQALAQRKAALGEQFSNTAQAERIIHLLKMAI